MGVFVGLCVLPAAFAGDPDVNALPVAACLFSVGALTIAAGIFLKARALQSQTESDAPQQKRRSRGGCELCGTDVPVIACKVHQLQLCAECLTGHYDLRSCAYVPPARRATGKAGKSLAARARGV